MDPHLRNGISTYFGVARELPENVLRRGGVARDVDPHSFVDITV